MLTKLFGLLLIGAGMGMALTPTDTMTVTDATGSGASNYPWQFARAFIDTEIRHFPQVIVNGTPVLTQADVKQRWPSGYVKHAVITVILSSLPSNATGYGASQLAITFQDQSTCHCVTDGSAAGITKTTMLASPIDFDATMSLTNWQPADDPNLPAPTTYTTSARTILTAWDGTSSAFPMGPVFIWTQGELNTTVILRANDGTYDFGWDASKALRPGFEVSFWPTLGANGNAKIRFVVDVTNTAAMEDQDVGAIAFTTGLASPATVFNNSSKAFHLGAASRVTRGGYWLNNTPPAHVNVYTNIAYERQTGYCWHWLSREDTALSGGVINFPGVSPTSIVTLYNLWWNSGLKAHANINEYGQLSTGMGAPGGRVELGPAPDFVVDWLESGDWHMFEITQGEAELAGSWPLHWREQNATKKWDIANSISGVGFPLSHNGRPSVGLTAMVNASVAADKFTFPQNYSILTMTATPSPAFVNDETVYVGASLAAATKKGFIVNRLGANLYVVPELGTFAAADAVVGTTSHATATIKTASSTQYIGVTRNNYTVDASSAFKTTYWTVFDDHAPELYDELYAHTGEFYWLDETMLWTAWESMWQGGSGPVPFTPANAYQAVFHSATAGPDMNGGDQKSRGITGREGGFYGQNRSWAWTIRGRAQMAYMMPVLSPASGDVANLTAVRDEYLRLQDSGAAFLEGLFDIKNGHFYDAAYDPSSGSYVPSNIQNCISGTNTSPQCEYWYARWRYTRANPQPSASNIAACISGTPNFTGFYPFNATFLSCRGASTNLNAYSPEYNSTTGYKRTPSPIHAIEPAEADAVMLAPGGASLQGNTTLTFGVVNLTTSLATTCCSYVNSNFQQMYILSAMGHAVELGQNYDVVLPWLGWWYAEIGSQPTDDAGSTLGTISPWAVGTGLMGAFNYATGNPVQTLAELEGTYIKDANGKNISYDRWLSGMGPGTAESYAAWATGAMSFLETFNVPNGKAAWENQMWNRFMKPILASAVPTNYYVYGNQMKWALTPQNFPGVPVTPPTTTPVTIQCGGNCTVNGTITVK